MAAQGAPPVTPIGYERQPVPVIANRLRTPFDSSWNAFIDDIEFVPELKWPGSVRAFAKMRTDAQLSGLYRAMTMPIRRYRWLINPNGARPELVESLASDLNLDVKGQDPKPRGRQRGRFSFQKHLYEALLALFYGHAYFEQLGVIGDDGMWHLRKLEPRPQDSIIQINVADDGGLISVKQRFTKQGAVGGGLSFQAVEIPVDRLVAYIWEQEGPSWIGRSIFRDCYRNWLVKDRLLRVDAINHERAGGVPWMEAQKGATPQEIRRLNQMAQSFKVGEDSGGAVPSGAKLNIARLGSGTDVISSIKYHDESMSRMFLHMFLQLGQTESGSRSLGMTFVEYAFLAQRAVAQWFIDITNEHVIEDWVDWNYGEKEEPVPLLDYVVEDEDEHIAVQDLVAAVDAGIVTVDPELEDLFRSRYGLGDKATSNA